MNSKRIISIIAAALTAIPIMAQKLTVGYLYPAGGQAGTTVEIEAGGLNLNKATKVLFSHPDIKGEIIPYVQKKSGKKKLNDQSSPQLADKVKIRIDIPSYVPCGLYDLRLQGPQGVSNMLPFEVASYPDFLESRKSTLKNPDVVEIPAVLCGQVTPGGVDYFKFTGHQGETIVASVKGRSLVPYIADAVPGWFQPVIKIVDTKGREIAYSDDYLYNVDPLIITELPKDGDYILMIHDAIYRGREDFNYRIQLGAIPFVTGRYPAYGVAGRKVRQHLSGVNLDSETATVSVKNAGYNQLTYTDKTGTSNAVSFYALPKGTSLMQFPKDGSTLSLNSPIADSLTVKDRVKRYRINVHKDEPVVVELIGRRNGSRIDAVMRLVDGYGKVVAEADDYEDPTQGLMTFHADPLLRYVPEWDETMTLEVEDIHGGYGKDYHYLLSLYKNKPSINAFVSPANITVPSGGTASFHIDISGKPKRAADLSIKGLPKGFTTSRITAISGKGWDVSVTVPEGAVQKRFPIELTLSYPTNEGMTEDVDVVPVDNMMQAFYYIHHIQSAELSMEVAEPSPYRMTLAFDPTKDIMISHNDEAIPVSIKIDRDPGFKEEIELELGKKNKMFTLDPVSILPDQTEKTIYIKLGKDVLSKYRGKKYKPIWQMNIVGTVKGEITKQGKRTFQNAKYREMTPYFVIKLK